MIVSLILPSFNRPELLDLGLSSILKNPIKDLFWDLEIVVVNDGMKDNTENVVSKYKSHFNIKYLWTGQRNIPRIIPRVPGFAINAGVKACSGEVIILSCPEVYHLNDALDNVLKWVRNGKVLMITESMYFDDVGWFTESLKRPVNYSFLDILSSLTCGGVSYEAVKMPYLMATMKQNFVNIGGYDEDFTGYAADDNDLVDRLVASGCDYCRMPGKIVHLYHGQRCDAQAHPENPAWVFNYDLYVKRKGKIIRNVGKEWGRG